MDRILRQQMLEVFKQSMTTLNERYVTGATLQKHIEICTVDWLKRNGSCLNPQRMKWLDENGKEHQTQPLYPLHEIMEMMHDGRIRELVMPAKKKNKKDNKK